MRQFYAMHVRVNMCLTQSLNLVSMRQFYAMHVRERRTNQWTGNVGFNASILRDACKRHRILG